MNNQLGTRTEIFPGFTPTPNPIPTSTSQTFSGLEGINLLPPDNSSTDQSLSMDLFQSSVPDGNFVETPESQSPEPLIEATDYESTLTIPSSEQLDINPLQDVFQNNSYEVESNATNPDINLQLDSNLVMEEASTADYVDIDIDIDENELPQYSGTTADSTLGQQPETIQQSTTELLQTKSIEPLPEVVNQSKLVQPKLYTDLSESSEPFPEVPEITALAESELTAVNYLEIDQTLYNTNEYIGNAMQIEGLTSLESLSFTTEQVVSLLGKQIPDSVINVLNQHVIGIPNPEDPLDLQTKVEPQLGEIIEELQTKSEQILENKKTLLELSEVLRQTETVLDSSKQMAMAIETSVANAERILSMPLEVTQGIRKLQPGTQAYVDVKNYITNPQSNSIELIILALNANNPELKLNKELIILEMITYQYRIELMELIEDFDSSIRISPEATDQQVENLRAIYLEVMTKIKLESRDKTKPINFEEIYQGMLERINKDKDSLPADFAISFVFNSQIYPVIKGSQSFIIFKPDDGKEGVTVDLLTNVKEAGLYTRQDLIQDQEDNKHYTSVKHAGKILTISPEDTIDLNANNQTQILEFYKDLIESQGVDINRSKYGNSILKHSLNLNGSQVQFVENWITNPFQKVEVRQPKAKEIYNQYQQAA